MGNLLRCYVWTSLVITVMLSSGDLHRYVTADHGSIGVNYGLLGDNLPNPKEVVAMYRQYKINKMRIFSPYPTVLNALQEDSVRYGPKNCIHLYVGTTNQDLAKLAGSVNFAVMWVQSNIVPYPNVCFDYITAGNEVVPGAEAVYVAPAIRNLRTALDRKGFYCIGVSTVVHSAVLGVSYPPSNGAFGDNTVKDMRAILKEISKQSRNSKLMINVYPYFAYISNTVHIKQDYAMFTSTAPVVYDGALAYYNLFDAMVDSFYAAMEREGFGNLGVTITESGWPSTGNGQYTTPYMAMIYNNILKKRIERGTGTPKRPYDCLQAFIFAMFNENKKPHGVEQNWGLFYPNKTAVYPIF